MVKSNEDLSSKFLSKLLHRIDVYFVCYLSHVGTVWYCVSTYHHLIAVPVYLFNSSHNFMCFENCVCVTLHFRYFYDKFMETKIFIVSRDNLHDFLWRTHRADIYGTTRSADTCPLNFIVDSCAVKYKDHTDRDLLYTRLMFLHEINFNMKRCIQTRIRFFFLHVFYNCSR